MSDFDLYILNKYLFIPLMVLCIPILWGPALQCGQMLLRYVCGTEETAEQEKNSYVVIKGSLT